MARPSASDPTWIYINGALARARAIARANGYKWNGDSCYIVSALALQIIINTREGKGGVPTEDVSDIRLSYADHYLHMRGVTAQNPMRAAFYRMEAEGYNALKRGIKRSQDDREYRKIGVNPSAPLKALGSVGDRLLREGNKPLSEPTAESLDWANAGVDEGLKDSAANPHIDNDPDIKSWNLNPQTPSQ